MPDFPHALREEKRRLREEMREKRRQLAPDENETNSKEFSDLANVFLAHVQLEPASVVASYHPFRHEINPTVLDTALRAQGHRIALPLITGRREPLLFRLHRPGDRLLANPLGILEPASEAPGIEPDVLLVPLLAFDSQRNRLGYGGGYYDRTLTTLRKRKPVQAIGIAYAFQEVPVIPVGVNDIPLDRIITEKGVW